MPTEMAALLAAPDVSTPLGLRDRAVLEVFYSCGLRRGELISLWPEISTSTGGRCSSAGARGPRTATYPSASGPCSGFGSTGRSFDLASYRPVPRPPLSLLVGDSAMSGLAMSPGPGVSGGRRHRQARQLSLLRHTVATLMLEGGADIRYVAEMLGHARLETTQRYTRVSIDRLRTVHATCHPAAGLSVAMASELCTALPGARWAIAICQTPPAMPRGE